MKEAVKYERIPPKELMTAFLQKKRVGHAYLLEGPSGTGKKELALWTASALMCLEPLASGLPCEECSNCRRIKESRHPDVVEIKPDGNSIKVDQIRFLKSEFSKSGMESAQKVFVIEEADKMTIGAANSLLKFLEEPDGKVTAFLLSTAKNRLLPTILSRCQMISFHAGPSLTRKRVLIEKGVPESRASLFVQLTNDNDVALEWNEEEWYQNILPLMWRWFSMLQKKDTLAFTFVQTELMPILKERSYQHQFFDIFVLLYRDLLFAHYGKTEEKVFSDYEKEMSTFSQGQSGIDIATILTLILTQKKKLESNVAIQGLLEQFVLEVLE